MRFRLRLRLRLRLRGFGTTDGRPRTTEFGVWNLEFGISPAGGPGLPQGALCRILYGSGQNTGEMMKFRRLGKTDLQVSSICLGTWVFGGDCWGEADDKESVRVVEKAIDLGVNFIDTAPIYGSGRSESVIGKALRSKKKRPVIATKLGLEKKGEAIRPNLSRAFIREEVTNSLKRLGVETIDLYQCHWPDPNTPPEETFGELRELVKEGKVRYIGVSNFDAEILKRVLHVADIASDQMQYSLFEREIEGRLLPLCAGRQVSLLAYGSLGGGILTGKYKAPPQLPKGDVRSFFYKYYGDPFWGRAVKVVSILEQIAARRKVPTAQVAINWVLSHKEVASCIVGCRNVGQLGKNIDAADWSLTAEEIRSIEDRYIEAFQGAVL